MSVYQRFAKDRRGAIGALSVFMIFSTIAFAALAIDVGSFFYHKRKLQSGADLAALAGASDIANAGKAALATLRRNGYAASNLQLVETGTYVANGAVAPGARFTPSASGAGNAVRVTSVDQRAFILGGIFNAASAATPPSSAKSAGSVSIRAQAVAAQVSFASFSVGSGLVSVNGGILNALLGGLLGVNVSLTAMNYSSLLSANVDMFAFSKALATQASLTGVTYTQLLSSNVRTNAALNAMISALQSSGSTAAAAAVTQIVGQRGGLFDTISLGNLVDFGPYDGYVVGQSGSVTTTMTALDLLSAIAQIADGTHQIQVALNANIPGIAGATLQLAVGERPRSVELGSVGASAHTAQTRLLLTVQLLGTGSISIVNVPIYIEIAQATAVLTAIQCGATNVNQSSVTLGVTPGVVTAWIGAVSAAAMTNFTTEPNPGPATLVSLPLATITGKATASISNMSATPVTFSYADITSATKHTTSTTDFVSSLLTSLIGDLSVQVNVLGLGLGLPSGLGQAVTQTIAGATAPIDQLVSAVLASLGVSLGQATTWVTGVKCGNAVLVN